MELERKGRGDEKKIESLTHKFEQTNSEKEHLKRQVDSLKHWQKSFECQEIKIQRGLAEEIHQKSKSPFENDRRRTTTAMPASTKFQTLQQMRKERKMKK